MVLAALACLAVLVNVERAPERPLTQQPFPDSAEYADAAHSLAHGKGYYTYVHSGSRQPPRYPPGYAMALTPFASVGSYPRDVQRGAKFWAMAYVVVAVLAAWFLGGPLAGIFAALLIGVSPFARDSAGLVLSDALIATLTVLMLPLLQKTSKSGTRLAGFGNGLAIIMRLTAAINLIALLVATPRRSYKTTIAWALPALVGLAVLQWAMFGSPLRTGYSYWGVSSHFFALSYATSESVVKEGPFIFADKFNGHLLSWICPCQVGGSQSSLPNLAFYPLLLLSAFWVFSPPLIPLAGLLYAWRRRRDAVGRYTLVVVALSLILFIFYQYQGTRFMAGPATLLLVLASVWLAKQSELLWRRITARQLTPEP